MGACNYFSSDKTETNCSEQILTAKGEQITEAESYHYYGEAAALAESRGKARRNCGTLLIQTQNGREVSLRYQEGSVDQRYEEQGYFYAGYLPEHGFHMVRYFEGLDYTFYLIRDSNGKRIEVSSHDLLFSPGGGKVLTFFDHSSLRTYKWEVTIFNPEDPRERYVLQLPDPKQVKWIPDSIRFEDEETLRLHRKYYDFYSQKYLPDTLVKLVRQ